MNRYVLLAFALVGFGYGCGGGGGDGGPDPTSPSNDSTSATIGTAGGPVTTPSGAAAVQIPAGVFSQPVQVTVERLPSSSPGNGPLPTTLKQYGPFYEISTSSPVTFSDFARVGVCQVTDPGSTQYPPEPHDQLRLAHRVGDNVEILDRVDVTDLVRCTNVTGDNSQSRLYRLARHVGLEKVVATVIGFVTPARLYAAHGGLGGKVKSFSPFGAVQIANQQFTSVSAGESFSCGVTGDGKVYCWGSNGNAQLGTGSVTPDMSLRPVSIAPTKKVSAVWASWGHACAVNVDQEGFCWGINTFGQSGDGTTNQVTVPTPVPGRFFSTGLSPDHMCALGVVELRASCFGRNNAGQLGIGSTDENPHTRPEAVVISNGSPTTWSNISVGPRHTCGSSGTFVYCWGDNGDGKLGDGTNINRNVPTRVAGNLSFSTVSAGDLFTCALTTAGQAYCWGQNSRGELGTGGTVQNQSTPVAVAGGLTFSAISSGGGHTCAIASSTQLLYCWGKNQFGQLGDLSSIDRPTPVAVAGGIFFKGVSAGSTHTCGISTSNIVFCWGNNSSGQLGDGTQNNHNIPIRVVDQQ
jgi:alpha-tubulin suppressor-like RCC1 family protein